MAEDRIFKLEKKQSAFEQWGWKTVSAIGMSLMIWFLGQISSNIKELKDDIIEIRLADSANSIRMNRLEDDVLTLKVDVKELSKGK